MRTRYSRWDGSQDPFGPDVPVADLLEEMSEDLLSGAGAQGAVSRLLRRGMQGRFGGLDALRARLREARAREQARLTLEGPLEELRERLDRILETERSTLSFRAEDDARMREAFLDQLPPDVPGQIQELSDYRFVDPEAQRGFDELMEHLKEQVLGAYFRNMAQGLRSLSPEDLERFRDMLADLNQMIEQRERGEPYDFEGFMQRHGDFFPDDPKTLDELLENMARRMAAMSRLMASLSPSQRAELQALAEQTMQDMDLAFEVDRLGANLSGMFPELPWGDPTLAGGEESAPLSATVDAMERLHDYEDLDRAMRGDYAGATIDDVDDEALRRTLGEGAVRDVRRLKQIERALEEAGLITRREGRLEVTPKGARKLGERALVRVFERLRRDREGTHEARETGGLAEPTGSTRPWHFGDGGQIAVQRTVFNAVVRSGAGADLRLEPEDFEMIEAEQRTEAATALLLDLSFSMPLRGHFVHAKKMALALHALIEGRYPHDTLYMIGFSDYARRMQPQDLTAAGWERVYGTNMQHAFNLAGRLLSQHPRASRQVIMVTDGEPTAHLEGEEVFFSWPPVPRTIHLTLSEALRLARSGVTLNVFMLEDSPGLIRFMERLAKLTAGRVFLMDDAELGDFVVRDYVSRRSR
ncbi:MAG: VWA domain-containing protein [Candidatus Velamenicoccus archaeovorus]